MTTDPSDFAIGAVLSQVWDDGEHPVTYESRKLNATEGNYATHEKELFAVIHALWTWRHYLLGNHFIVVTNHNWLKHLHTQPTLSRRQARWAEFIAEFDFEIVYRLGKSNVVADALSRLNVVDCGTSSRVYHREDLLKGLEQAYKKKKETKRILEGLDDQKDFQVVQNKIYYTRNGRMRLYLLAGKFRDLIMQECHDTRYAGHLGMRKMTDLILIDF